MTQSEQLRHYNRWRRGDEHLEQPDPKAIGELLENVACRLETLERELNEFCEEAQSLLMEASPGKDCAYADWRKARNAWMARCRLILRPTPLQSAEAGR